MANIDYSKSAVNLTNPDSVRTLLDMRSVMTETMEKHRAVLHEVNKELFAEIDELTRVMADNEADIRTAVERDGSYQDLAVGFYAVKQRKVTISYDAYRFKQRYPEFAPAVIIETVDTVKLSGLIKGGLITMDALLTKGGPSLESVATEKPTFVYIIKAGG